MIALGPAIVLVWLFYVLPCWALGVIEYTGWARTEFGWSWNFRVAARHSSWFDGQWRDWVGWSGPAVVVVQWDGQGAAGLSRTYAHELEHVDQQYRWGLLFYPAYFLSSLWIWLFQQEKHAYLDNPFERGARRAAGQRVDVPRELWGQGPDDRWPWW